MSTFNLHIPYGAFVNIHADLKRNAETFNQAFSSFRESYAGDGKARKALIYGGGDSGSTCYSFLKDIDRFDVSYVMDRGQPNEALSDLAHLLPGEDHRDKPCDVAFVATAPRHYGAIEKALTDSFGPDLDICFLYDDDQSDLMQSGKQLPLTDIYESIYQEVLNSNFDAYSMATYKRMANGEWVDYENFLLKKLPFGVQDKLVLDYGCGTGVLTPLLKERGADGVIGVEASHTHIENLNTMFGKRYDNVRYVSSEQGYLPVLSETVDIVIMNEVISHITYGWLDTAYIEVNRVLRPGGMLIISDGNNLHDATYWRETLLPMFEEREKGHPEGKDDPEAEPHRLQRRKIIAKRHPNLDDTALDYLADNTFSLFGDFLLKTVDDYVAGREFIPRPYQRGICPISPEDGYFLCERGFFPEQIMYHLQSHGFHCRSLFEREELKSQPQMIILATKAVC